MKLLLTMSTMLIFIGCGPTPELIIRDRYVPIYNDRPVIIDSTILVVQSPIQYGDTTDVAVGTQTKIRYVTNPKDSLEARAAWREVARLGKLLAATQPPRDTVDYHDIDTTKYVKVGDSMGQDIRDGAVGFAIAIILFVILIFIIRKPI